MALICAGQFVLVSQRALDGVQDIIQVLAEVFGQEAEHEISMFLERGVLAPVATVSLGISQMLSAIQFDHQASSLAEQIHFHSALCIERDGELRIQAEAAGSGWQRLQAAVEKRFARAARPGHAFGLGDRG